MSAPAISVIMPVYNGARYVAQAIDSILAQSFGNFEFHIVDDGSTDRSLKILRAYEKRDNRIKIISRPNTGIVGALNDALAAAQGEFIARMDADDIAMPQRFQTQLDYLRAHPDILALGSRVIGIDPCGLELFRSEHQLDHEKIDAELLNGVGWAIVHPSVMMRRDAVQAVGGYRKEFQWVEDLDLFLRLSERGRLANLEQFLLNYRQHTESVNRTRAARQAELADALVRQTYLRRGKTLPAGWKFVPKPKPLKDVQLRTWAWRAMKAGNIPAARKHAVELWKTAPLSVESWRTLLCAMRGH